MSKSSCVLFAIFILTAILAGTSCSGVSGDANPAYSYVAEGRGTWIGRTRNVDWDSTMAALAAAGINMVFPNMCSAGAASYSSEFLPMTTERDELALCIEAAHRYGIEVHVWRINWYMSGCPDSFTTAMEQAGRIQYSWDGKRNPQVMKEQGYDQNRDWLCPSHPDNRKLEFDSMLELVRKYDVDGVHFDYMRYSNDQLCYCDGCRKRFAEDSGLKLDNWPKEVWKEGPYREVYLDWRRKLIQSSAREIARAVHTLDPYVCVSLAARTGVSWAYESDAQVWWDWIGEGILDFVCPMNYTGDPERFETTMKSHLPLTRGQVPYYSGIGLYEMKTLEPMLKNIAIGRELGQDGWLTFELRSLRQQLEPIGRELNTTPALLPHRAPETHFFFDKTESETEEGFPVYAPGQPAGCRVSLMLRGKLHAGISRLTGDAVVVAMDGQVVQRLNGFDQRTSSILELAPALNQPGRYRLSLYGMMTLSNGEEKPFIVKSFPFQVRS